MPKKQNFVTSWHLATNFAILGVTFIKLTLGSAMAQPCPGKSFDSFFDALLEKKSSKENFLSNRLFTEHMVLLWMQS